MTIWRMRIACWIPNAAKTHSECVIPLLFPLQQWLHARALLLCYSTLPVLSSFWKILQCMFALLFAGIQGCC